MKINKSNVNIVETAYKKRFTRLRAIPTILASIIPPLTAIGAGLAHHALVFAPDIPYSFGYETTACGLTGLAIGTPFLLGGKALLAYRRWRKVKALPEQDIRAALSSIGEQNSDNSRDIEVLLIKKGILIEKEKRTEIAENLASESNRAVLIDQKNEPDSVKPAMGIIPKTMESPAIKKADGESESEKIVQSVQASPINPPASANVNDSEKRELWNMLKERVRKTITELQGKVKQANNLSEINFIRSELIPLKTDINRLSQFSYYDEDYDEIIAADIQMLDIDLIKEENRLNNPDQKYVYIRGLGKGGMAGVSLYWHVNTNRYVAIKTILGYKDLNDDKKKEMRERMEQEQRSLNALKGHPNVVEFIKYDRNGDENGPMLIMEYVDGISLYNKLDRLSKKRYKIPPEEAVDIALQILSALEAGYGCKGQKIIHRDLTPNNIILVKGKRNNEDGRVKIIDYGIAKLLIAPNAETQAGLFFGKSGYASLEQIQGGEVDYKTDIFSLGVILYEMLTDSKPYPYKLNEGDNALKEAGKYLYSLLNNTPDFKHPNIPASLRPILRKMLEKNKDTRADHQEIKAALDAFLSGTPVVPKTIKAALPV